MYREAKNLLKKTRNLNHCRNNVGIDGRVDNAEVGHLVLLCHRQRGIRRYETSQLESTLLLGRGKRGSYKERCEAAPHTVALASRSWALSIGASGSCM